MASGNPPEGNTNTHTFTCIHLLNACLPPKPPKYLHTPTPWVTVTRRQSAFALSGSLRMINRLLAMKIARRKCVECQLALFYFALPCFVRLVLFINAARIFYILFILHTQPVACICLCERESKKWPLYVLKNFMVWQVNSFCDFFNAAMMIRKQCKEIRT